MGQQEQNDLETEEPEIDRMAVLVTQYAIRSEHRRVQARPDVSQEEQERWIRQDPEYPPEHYICSLRYSDKEMTLYQTVGADYPDEDDEIGDTDLYADQRDLLLSPEFLLETTALKANSVDTTASFEEWVDNGCYESMTPRETYDSYVCLRQELYNLLGSELYEVVVATAVEADYEREESDD